MSRILTFAEFFTVRRRLRAGVRHTEIARELDLFVWTATRIATEPQFQADPILEADLPQDDPPPDYAARKLRRCPGCGAMVYRWPCLACVMEHLPRLPLAEEVDDDAEGGDELFDLFDDAEVVTCEPLRLSERHIVPTRERPASGVQPEAREETSP